jgi:glycosyltransferase involved in cell wall biosynthesis
MKKGKPLISVIMPVKDAGEFVGRAVTSIVDQTYKNWEMIIVDDGSRDQTAKILKKMAKQDKRITVITNNTSRGIGACLNMTLKQARGTFIARMDGDDISLPNRFATQLAFLQKNPKVVAVGGQAQMIDGEGKIFALKHFPTDSKTLREMIMWVVPIQHPIMMARASAYKKCRYNESYKTAEDVEMFMQLLQYGEFANVSDTVYQYRKADTSNGYHNLKQTFYLTLLGRVEGILKYGYIPTIKGVIFTLSQLGVILLLPAKWIIRLYESRRFGWTLS